MANMKARPMVVCGHRGAARRAPENTRASLEAAIAAGAVLAEIDVRLTADGRAILFHDPVLGRTAPGRGPVSALTWAELRRLDAGAWFGAEFVGQRIPDLGSMLELAAGRLRLNIELKNDDGDPGRGRALAGAVLEEIARAGDVRRCLLTSFDHALIDAVAAAHPSLECGRVIGAGPLADPAGYGPGRVLSVRHGLLDEDFVARAHAAGRAVHAWTANAPEDLRKLERMGVDVVITDDPAGAAEVLQGN